MSDAADIAHRRGATVLGYAAFTERPHGGNPAGVVLDATGMAEEEMQAIAARVGYSETAFLMPDAGDPGGQPVYAVRYFTPEVEVPFCGHATIAAAVALAERDGPGPVTLRAPAGVLALESRAEDDGRVVATMLTVSPQTFAVDSEDVGDAVAALGWTAADLDANLPPRVAYAGARHLILAARRRERLADVAYDYEALAAVARRLELITVALIWREQPLRYHARNLGPRSGSSRTRRPVRSPRPSAATSPSWERSPRRRA